MKLFLLMLAFGADADAAKKKKKKTEGVMVTILVLDEDTNEPIPNAKIKHEEEELSHQVNEQTGEWRDSQVFLKDGNTLHFTPGSNLKLTVAAANYQSEEVSYDIHRWRNKVEVRLKKLDDEFDISIPNPSLGGDQGIDPPKE